MAKKRYELDTRILTIFFFVAMPFVAFGSFLIVSMARASLRESLGSSFEQRAFETKFLLERYLADQADHLRALALDPQLRAALATPARERSAEDAKQLEQDWVQGQESKLITGILTSPLSGRLRDAVQVYPAVRLLQLVDATGRLVASSTRGGRLLNGETSWFRALVEDGTDSPYVGDVRRPQGASLPVLELAFPVYNGERRLQGALRGLVDAAHLYGVLAPVRVGHSGRARLIRRADGMILASNESHEILKEPFPGFPQIEAAMRERRGYWVVPERGADPARLVAYSPVEQLATDWLVVVEQDYAEAMAPIQEVTRYLWVHFIGAFGSVILLALYLSFKLEAPVIDEELHLHEAHVPSGTRSAGVER